MDRDSTDFDEKKDSGRRRRREKENDDRQERKQSNLRDKVCRDFLRNVCYRGSNCKFDHPKCDQHQQRYYFCHEFQNGYCSRNKTCRFIHSSYADEKHYLRTGKLPPHLLDAYEKQLRASPDDTEVSYCKKFLTGHCWGEECNLKHVTVNEYRKLQGRSPSPLKGPEVDANSYERQSFPYCKAYLWGDCCFENCRYRHVTRSEYHNIEGRSPTPLGNDDREHNVYERQDVDSVSDKVSKFGDDYYEPERKRPFLDNNTDRMDNGGFECNVPFQSRPQPERSCMMLEEENMMLRERINELKKRIDDLQVINEFLLEQNAHLRFQQEKNAAGLTAMTVPAVAITNGVPGANQMQQDPTPQQMVTAALRTVTASVATVPVSIATVTPVSLGAVSMAPVQQMAPSVMTIAQQSAPPSEPQIVPQPLPMPISAPSVPLVSYPIMSRTVMQQSAQPPPNLRH